MANPADANAVRHRRGALPDGVFAAVPTARKGFLVVVQDTRGRFASEGDWTPFRAESEDGYDSVEWAAQLPGSNGRVGMFGESYVGNVQWPAAIEQPPSLAAIAPTNTWADPLDGLFSRGGALELGLTLPWSLGSTGIGHVANADIPEPERGRRVAAIIDEYDRLADDGYWELPVHEAAVLRRHSVPDIGTIRMLTDPAMPTRCRVTGRHERVTVPTFIVSAWHDIFVQGALDNYAAMVALGRPARLVVAPWTHLTLVSEIGELFYGLRGGRNNAPARGLESVRDWELAWLRGHLEARAQEAEWEAPARIFVMGRDMWRDETSSPLERARDERWFLRADGELDPRGPASDGVVSEFVYDPADPVPTRGGHTVMTPGFPPGPFDQTAIEARPDVPRLYLRPASARPRDHRTGKDRLHAEGSAPSTDWVARLCDVHPDGRSFNLCDGILRIPEGADARRRIEIDVWSTSNVFLAGHHLRVHVTSSSFHRWDRNLNTGDQRAARYETARQRVHHDAEHPSWIELPVID